jgi:alkylhydroperoxidase/carboxymuconolactone decarboxylase family protein YurZ
MKQNILNPVTIQTAPAESRPTLEKIQKTFGFIPNLVATFANSPTVLHGYLAMDAVWEKGTFSPVERSLVLLAASVVNNCGYLDHFNPAPLDDAFKAESNN